MRSYAQRTWPCTATHPTLDTACRCAVVLCADVCGVLRTRCAALLGNARVQFGKMYVRLRKASGAGRARLELYDDKTPGKGPKKTVVLSTVASVVASGPVKGQKEGCFMITTANESQLCAAESTSIAFDRVTAVCRRKHVYRI